MKIVKKDKCEAVSITKLMNSSLNSNLRATQKPIRIRIKVRSFFESLF